MGSQQPPGSIPLAEGPSLAPWRPRNRSLFTNQECCDSRLQSPWRRDSTTSSSCTSPSTTTGAQQQQQQPEQEAGSPDGGGGVKRPASRPASELDSWDSPVKPPSSPGSDAAPSPPPAAFHAEHVTVNSEEDLRLELHRRMRANDFLLLFRATSMIHHEPLHARAQQLMHTEFAGTHIGAHIICARTELESSTYHPHRSFWAIIAPMSQADQVLRVVTHQVAVQLALWNLGTRVSWEWDAHGGLAAHGEPADWSVDAEGQRARVYDQLYMHLLPHTDHDVAINFCASEVFRVSDADAIIGPAAAAWLAEPEDSPRRLWFAGVVQRYSQQGNRVDLPLREDAHLSEPQRAHMHQMAAAAPAEPLEDFCAPGNLTPFSSYVLGLICADGHVSQGEVTISLASGDMAHLLHIWLASGFVNKSATNKLEGLKLDGQLLEGRACFLPVWRLQMTLTLRSRRLSQGIRACGVPAGNKTILWNAQSSYSMREALAQPHVTRASFLYGYFCGDGNISETVDGGGRPYYRMSICGGNLEAINNLRVIANMTVLGQDAGAGAAAAAGAAQVQQDVNPAEAAEVAPGLVLAQRNELLAQQYYVLRVKGRNIITALLDGVSREVLAWEAAGHRLQDSLQGSIRCRAYLFQGQLTEHPVFPSWVGLTRKGEIISRAVSRPQGALLFPSRAYLPAASVTPLGPTHAWVADPALELDMLIRHWVGGEGEDGGAEDQTRRMCAPVLTIYHNSGDGGDANDACITTPTLNALLLTTSWSDSHKTLSDAKDAVRQDERNHLQNALACAVGATSRLVPHGSAVTQPALQLAQRLLLRHSRRSDAGSIPTVWSLGVGMHTLMHVPKVDYKFGDLDSTDLRSHAGIRNDDTDGRRPVLQRLTRRNATLLTLALYQCRQSGQRVGLALRLPWRLELVIKLLWHAQGHAGFAQSARVHDIYTAAHAHFPGIEEELNEAGCRHKGALQPALTPASLWWRCDPEDAAAPGPRSYTFAYVSGPRRLRLTYVCRDRNKSQTAQKLSNMHIECAGPGFEQQQLGPRPFSESTTWAPTVNTHAGLGAERARAQAQTALQSRHNAAPPQHEPPAELLTELRTDIQAGPAATMQRFVQEATAAGATSEHPMVVGMRSWQAHLTVGADVDLVDIQNGRYICPGRIDFPLATAGNQIPDTVRVGVRVLGPVPPERASVLLRQADVGKRIYLKMGTGALQPPGMARPGAPTERIRL